MREIIARAALEAVYGKKLVSPIPKEWLKAADAVLAAMRKPTEAMLDAGASVQGGVILEDWSEVQIFPGIIWKAMIDEAAK